MKVLLSLDMSTTCTGWSTFDCESGKLIEYGTIKGKNVKDRSKWRATLRKMKGMAESIASIVVSRQPTYIVIEEIAGSKNRIGQKTLDMLHGVVWIYLESYLDVVDYYDVGGADGWRTDLKMRLSDADKLANKEAKKLNKNLSPKQRLPVYDWKDLACRYVNSTYGLCLDPQRNSSDGDIGDSIAMGSSWIMKNAHRF